MIVYENGNQTPRLRKYHKSRKGIPAVLSMVQWCLLVLWSLSAEEEDA